MTVTNTTTMTDVSTNTDVILVNTVLTFLQYGLNTATVQNVLKVASSTFSMKEVKTAVSLLWKSCDLGNVPNSRGSNNRTQCDAYHFRHTQTQHWDHRHNTHIRWKTIHGLYNSAHPPTLNTSIAFNNLQIH